MECRYLVPSGYGTFIEANSDEEAKQKAVEWTLEKGEIIGDWIGERNDVMHASIASNRRKYHISNIVLYVKTDRISPYKWTPGIIIKDYNGIPLNSQLLYGERIKRTNIKRFAYIRWGLYFLYF